MRLLPVLFLLLQADVQEEYQEKLEKVKANSAAKHYSIGGYLSMSKMHAWAREQYYKTIEFDTNHEKARRKLGYRMGDSGEWESDATIKQQFSNVKKSASQVAKLKKSVDSRMERLGKDLARQWLSLGKWCDGKKLEKEAAHAYKRAIEYDPANTSARKALGFEKNEKGVWLSKAERELRQEMRGGISSAPKGSNLNEQSLVESRTSIRTKKRDGEKFKVESSHLKESQLVDLLQHAEHAYKMYHKLFERQDLFEGQKMTHLILQNQQQHVTYVNAFRTGSPAQMELARKSSGSMGFPIAEMTQGNAPYQLLQDSVVHATIQICSHFFVGGPNYWIHEGVSYHFTRLMKGTAMTYCVDLAGTTPQSDGKNYQDPENWPVVCKVWVRDGKDPNINAVIKCTNLAELSGAETVKAWSLVDFLITDHKDKFIQVCQELKAGGSIEKALKDIFGWTPDDLDARWKAYVKISY